MRSQKRSLAFYLLAAFFGLFVLFLYGPMITIFILSFQGPDGGLTLPMKGFSLYWFSAIFQTQRIGSFGEPFGRSLLLGVLVMLLTAVISVMTTLAFRRKFWGSRALFYLTIASLIVPSILISFGILVVFSRFDLPIQWNTSVIGGHLTWTLPFAFLIMLGVFNRFNPSYEEAARDLGASDAKTFWQIVFPLIAPSVIGVALLGFTLSYDEFTRSALIAGDENTLPLEIYGMTTNVTSPVLYALGTLTTVFSFSVIAIALILIQFFSRRQQE